MYPLLNECILSIIVLVTALELETYVFPLCVCVVFRLNLVNSTMMAVWKEFVTKECWIGTATSPAGNLTIVKWSKATSNKFLL